MIISPENIELVFKGFKTLYTDAYTAAPIFYDKIAMVVPSSARNEAYGWLGQFPQLREWLDGEREVKDLTAHGFTIENRKFESTIGLRREDLADDRVGVFKPMVQDMGHRARQHPDELVFAMLANGFATQCYDGQNFFDTDHPAKNANGDAVTVSNMADGADQPWFLIDTTRPIKPVIWQEREKYEFTRVTSPTDHEVFMTDVYKMGIRARVNAGFGLWQLAYGSRQPLTPESYAAARAAMMKLRGNEGRIMGINPSTLVVGPDLEEAGAKIVRSAVNDGGGSNPWNGTADLVVTPYLEG